MDHFQLSRVVLQVAPAKKVLNREFERSERISEMNELEEEGLLFVLFFFFYFSLFSLFSDRRHRCSISSLAYARGSMSTRRYHARTVPQIVAHAALYTEERAHRPELRLIAMKRMYVCRFEWRCGQLEYKDTIQ